MKKWGEFLKFLSIYIKIYFYECKRPFKKTIKKDYT